ncbi:MAG: uroporphyrinogen-III synthase [Pseudomonadota bacterium]
MRIWVTRPVEDAQSFAEALSKLGHTPLIAPLFSRTTILDETLARQLEAYNPTHTIVTSRNALRSASDNSALSAIIGTQMIAVGPGTADLARQLGFAQVRHGPGRASDIMRLITPHQHNSGRAGTPRYLVLRGEDVTFDIATALTDSGCDVMEATTYRMEPEPNLPDQIGAAIADGALDAVTLFSPRAAERYVALVKGSALERQASQLTHYCLSDRISYALAPLEPPCFAVACQPNVQEMLALIGGPAAHSVH